MALIAQAIYPNGTANPSVAGVDVGISRGWAIPRQEQQALAAGAITVTVFPLDVEQKTTRYPKDWYVTAQPTFGLTMTALGDTLTLGGTPSSPLNAAIFVNGISYVYPVQPGDELADIATGLATLANADNAASSSGPMVRVFGQRVSGRVGGFGTMQREIKRQKRSFQITFWCPDWTTRDAVVPPVDIVLADTDFITLPDGTGGRLLYERSRVVDRDENENLYRRDLVYSVEYATTQTQGVPQVVDFAFQFTDPNGIPILSPGNLLLSEDGQAILNETRQRIAVARPKLTTDDGTAILAEDGQRIILG